MNSVFLLFFLGNTDNILPKSQFSEPIFGHSAGSTKLDRPHCKQFRRINSQSLALQIRTFKPQRVFVTSVPEISAISSLQWKFSIAIAKRRNQPHNGSDPMWPLKVQEAFWIAHLAFKGPQMSEFFLFDDHPGRSPCKTIPWNSFFCNLSGP